MLRLKLQRFYSLTSAFCHADAFTPLFSPILRVAAKARKVCEVTGCIFLKFNGLTAKQSDAKKGSFKCITFGVKIEEWIFEKNDADKCAFFLFFNFFY